MDEHRKIVKSQKIAYRCFMVGDRGLLVGTKLYFPRADSGIHAIVTIYGLIDLETGLHVGVVPEMLDTAIEIHEMKVTK